MRTWDVFYPKVLPEVLGCPEPTVDEHLRDAARRFCAETRCWREVLDQIPTRAGRADYDLYLPDESEGEVLLDATLNGQGIGFDSADGSTLAERVRGTAPGRRVRTTDMRVATLMPTPAADGLLLLEAALKPSQDATGVPDQVGDRYPRELADGALATLLLMNKVPWSNPALAGVFEAKFTGSIAKVKSRVWRGNSNNRPRPLGQFY